VASDVGIHYGRRNDVAGEDVGLGVHVRGRPAGLEGGRAKDGGLRNRYRSGVYRAPSRGWLRTVGGIADDRVRCCAGDGDRKTGVVKAAIHTELRIRHNSRERGAIGGPRCRRTEETDNAVRADAVADVLELRREFRGRGIIRWKLL